MKKLILVLAVFAALAAACTTSQSMPSSGPQSSVVATTAVPSPAPQASVTAPATQSTAVSDSVPVYVGSHNLTADEALRWCEPLPERNGCDNSHFMTVAEGSRTIVQISGGTLMRMHVPQGVSIQGYNCVNPNQNYEGWGPMDVDVCAAALRRW